MGEKDGTYNQVREVHDVGAVLSHLIVARQFQLLFNAADVPCPPEEFQTCGDPERWNEGKCLACWQGYTRCQALEELGLIEKMDDVTVEFHEG